MLAGSAAAFFNESMRRDAMSGISILLANPGSPAIDPEAKMMDASVAILHKVMSIKYCVASRKIESKRLGMPGYLPCLGFLASKNRLENTRTSAMAHNVGSAGYESRRNS